MKKLLALFLALLIPMGAAAETKGLTISVKADEMLFNQGLKAVLQMLPEGMKPQESEAWISVIQHLLDGMKVNISIQEDALSMDLHLAKGKLLDAAVHKNEHGFNMTSSLLSGVVLTQPADGASLLTSVKRSIETWLADFEPTTTRGVFTGDAYEGGTQCTTWSFTDMDIAAFMSALMTDEVRSVATLFMEAAGLPAATLLKKYDALNARVADDDEHMYILRVVRDAKENVVGISLSVYGDVAQVATVSAGFNGDMFKLVTGLGLKRQNYWYELSGDIQKKGDVTSFDGTINEWTSNKTDGFSYVKENQEPAKTLYWNCGIAKDGEQYIWNGGVYSDAAKVEKNCLYSSSGAFKMDAGFFAGEVRLGASSASPVKLTIQSGPSAGITPLGENLQYYAIEDLKEPAVYQRLYAKASLTLTTRLFKLLPFDVVMKLSDLLLSD